MGLAFAIEASDGGVDGAVEVVGIGKGAIGEVMLLEIAPAVLDRVEFRGILGQPFDRQPRACGQRLGRQLASVDRSMIATNGLAPGRP